MPQGGDSEKGRSHGWRSSLEVSSSSHILGTPALGPAQGRQAPGWSEGWWDRRAVGSLDTAHKECAHLCTDTVGDFYSHCWWECKWVQPLWKTVWRRLKKLKIELPYDPAIPLLGIYLKKTKTLIQKDTCTPMFIAALFTIAKIWK